MTKSPLEWTWIDAVNRPDMKVAIASLRFATCSVGVPRTMTREDEAFKQWSEVAEQTLLRIAMEYPKYRPDIVRIKTIAEMLASNRGEVSRYLGNFIDSDYGVCELFARDRGRTSVLDETEKGPRFDLVLCRIVEGQVAMDIQEHTNDLDAYHILWYGLRNWEK